MPGRETGGWPERRSLPRRRCEPQRQWTRFDLVTHSAGDQPFRRRWSPTPGAKHRARAASEPAGVAGGSTHRTMTWWTWEILELGWDPNAGGKK